jgi:hypothetical protein
MQKKIWFTILPPRQQLNYDPVSRQIPAAPEQDFQLKNQEPVSACSISQNPLQNLQGSVNSTHSRALISKQNLLDPQLWVQELFRILLPTVSWQPPGMTSK